MSTNLKFAVQFQDDLNELEEIFQKRKIEFQLSETHKIIQDSPHYSIFIWTNFEFRNVLISDDSKLFLNFVLIKITQVLRQHLSETFGVNLRSICLTEVHDFFL